MGACEVLQRVSPEQATSFNKALEELLEREATRLHLLLLDGALDRWAAEDLFKAREAGSFAGVALATGESPPSQPRFRGLRCQITVLYWGIFVPLEDWETCSGPPILVRTCLGDIMHCPGKKGADVSKCLEKQLARVGLNCYDVVSGTGDGGGENEGHLGVHSYFEHLNPGYVRRRCVPHIAWRTCDSAIRASSPEYQSLCAYFCEGVTWTRLKEIATNLPELGGLGVFSSSSADCKRLFAKQPAGSRSS